MVSFEGVSELGNGGWGLQSHEHNGFLSLDSDILWPSDESSHVFGWLDISSNSEVSSALGEEGSSSLGFGCDLSDFLWHKFKN